MRAPQLLLISIGALLSLGGCASHAPPASPALDPADVPAYDPIVDQLEEARSDYYEGVRAWVREDLPEAEQHLLRCREALAFADDSGDFTESQARDAETLLAKADYFLGQIDERLVVAPGDEAPRVVEPPTAAGPDWTVTRGRIEPVQNRHVDRWIRYFTGEGRPTFQKWLDRKGRYEPIFEPIFAKHGLPPELTYHAMIESGFRPGAYSWAHAVGLWQFIRTTARNHGLRADWWIDERRDPVRSTEAASTYMAALYEEFGDWELALAAYNVGEARIRKQIRRQGTRDFWKLKLPRETRNHVPKFYAAVLLGADPEKHGFRLGSETPPAVETIDVDFCVDFEVLGEAAGVSAKTIADLNPSLVRHCTPPDETGFAVFVPAGTGARASAALASLPEERRVKWAHHRVRRGDTLSVLARKYGTTTRGIQEANRLRSAHFLSIGQDLLIPSGRSTGGTPPRYASSGPSAATRKITYVVKSGDTLSQIAERHGTSARKLRRWNSLGRFIHPGQKLTIHASSRGSSGSSGGSQSYTVRVRKGDTLWDIARAHGVSLQALRSANRLPSSGLIRPGDLVRIPRS